MFPAPGRYRIVVSAFLPVTNPQTQNNFQLFTNVTARGPYKPQPVPPFTAAQSVDGYRFQVQGTPHLHAIQASFLTVKVTDPQGQPVTFTTWRGALAHAIFIDYGTLDYFHTHVCAPDASTAPPRSAPPSSPEEQPPPDSSKSESCYPSPEPGACS